jgi:hypothetical protein
MHVDFFRCVGSIGIVTLTSVLSLAEGEEERFLMEIAIILCLCFPIFHLNYSSAAHVRKPNNSTHDPLPFPRERAG